MGGPLKTAALSFCSSCSLGLRDHLIQHLSHELTRKAVQCVCQVRSLGQEGWLPAREAPLPPQQPWTEVTVVTQGPWEPRERGHNRRARRPDCLHGSRAAESGAEWSEMLPWKPGGTMIGPGPDPMVAAGQSPGAATAPSPTARASDARPGSLEPRGCEERGCRSPFVIPVGIFPHRKQTLTS